MNHLRDKLILIFLLGGMVPAILEAQVTLPAIFSDGMVVQRELPVHVWGKAKPGEKVTATFRGETRSDTADRLGHWSLYLSPSAAGGPFDLVLRGTNETAIHDILVGDVWIASGQSNMEFPLRQADNGEAEIAAANFPKIRLVRVHRSASDYPLDDVTLDSPWQRCTPVSVRQFSAVAYYFSREIFEKENVPIGVIETTWGGTLAESWTSLEALAADASLMPVFAARARFVKHRADIPVIRANEEVEKERARAAGQTEPRFPWHPLQEMWAPAALYNSMIAPLTKYGIRGVIWYQGESNSVADRAGLYERLFQTLIRDWRDQWREGDFPFLFTQIVNYVPDFDEDWATIRNAQRRALILRNTAMAVTIDIGNPKDVHPTNKRDVGHRLALAARGIAYGEKVEYSGPLFRQATREEHSLRIWFDHADGLVASGGEVKAFEVAGDDGRFFPATGRIEGTTVVLSSDSVSSPVAARYGWSNNPECNLRNAAGLPASPFVSTEYLGPRSPN